MLECYPDPDYMDLDEYLAEYVDGVMDPDVRAVFEELLRRDPALLVLVEQLQATRQTLCQLDCQCEAPPGFQLRLRDRLACECEQLLESTAEARRTAFRFGPLVVLLAMGTLFFSVQYFDFIPESTAATTTTYTAPLPRPPLESIHTRRPNLRQATLMPVPAQRLSISSSHNTLWENSTSFDGTTQGLRLSSP